ncbi:MAG: heme-binding protein [bacterium]
MTELTLAQANKMIEAALAKAREMKLPPLAIAVMDSGGHLKALQREDGLSFFRVQICQAKAWGAVGMAESSRKIGARTQLGPTGQGFLAALGSLSGGMVIPVPGGVPVRDGDGNIVGAVGASGAKSEDDETCAVAGIEAAGFAADAEG